MAGTKDSLSRYVIDMINRSEDFLLNTHMNRIPRDSHSAGGRRLADR